MGNILEARVLDLADYGAWKGSPFVASVPARVESTHEAAAAWFTALAAGEIGLPATSSPGGPTADDSGPRYASRARAFTSDELDGL